MAERITEQEARAFIESPVRRGDKSPKYPWHQWCDGSWWRIERGVDYDIPTTDMHAGINKRATRHEWGVEVVQRRDVVVFRFIIGRRGK